MTSRPTLEQVIDLMESLFREQGESLYWCQAAPRIAELGPSAFALLSGDGPMYLPPSQAVIDGFAKRVPDAEFDSEQGYWFILPSHDGPDYLPPPPMKPLDRMN